MESSSLLSSRAKTEKITPPKPSSTRKVASKRIYFFGVSDVSSAPEVDCCWFTLVVRELLFSGGTDFGGFRAPKSPFQPLVRSNIRFIFINRSFKTFVSKKGAQ